MEMETTQIGGVDSTNRKMSARLAAGATLRVRERLLTDGSQQAVTDFDVTLDGDGSGCDLISRSVARDDSHQSFRSLIRGNRPCTGHSECDAIIIGHGKVSAAPELVAGTTRTPPSSTRLPSARSRASRSSSCARSV